MGQTIISAIGVYISTSIDYLIVLIILFAQLSQNKQKWHIYAGQYLGTGLLVGVSLVAAYVVNFVPEAWMVGLLGLIPIYLVAVELGHHIFDPCSKFIANLIGLTLEFSQN